MLAKQQAENQQQQEHKQQQERKISKNKGNSWNAYHSRETSNGRYPATVRTPGKGTPVTARTMQQHQQRRRMPQRMDKSYCTNIRDA
jgi:hypothetical protein